MTIRQQIHNWLYGENSREQNRVRALAHVPIDQRIAMTALVMPDQNRVWGIDISHWNLPPVDLKRMRDVYGLKFVIIKGCDGSVRSRYSAEHVATAKAAGLPWGFYDWLYPNGKVSIAAQTDAWTKQAKEFSPPMGIFIDAEWTKYAGQPANPSAADLRAAHDQVRAKYKPATTYTAKGYADTYLKGFDWTREEFWVASYGGGSPLMPLGVKLWKWWQFTATLNGKLLDPSGNAEIDGNYWNGTEGDFRARYGGAGEPPPTGEPMKQYKVIWSAGVARRSAPTTTGSATGLPAYSVNQVVDVLQDNIPDQTYPTDPNKKWVQFADGFYGASIYGAGSVRMVDVTEPPSQGLPDLPVTITLGDDVKYIKQTVNVVLKPK